MKLKNITGTVENGKFNPDYPIKFKALFGQFEGKEVILSLKKKTKKRSLNQNSYYWGVVLELISEQIGLSTEEAHEAMKLKFLKFTKNNIETVQSTKRMKTVDFEGYLVKVRAWANEFLGVMIPLPNEVLEYVEV